MKKLILAILFAPLWLSAADQGAAEQTSKTLVWPDGTRYVGGVIDGKRSGKGTIFWQDGTRFVGQFDNDLRNGPGTMILPDGTVYTGYFKNDELTEPPGESTAMAQDPVLANVEPEPNTGEAAITIMPSVKETATASSLAEPSTTDVKSSSLTITGEIENELANTIDLWRAAWAEKNSEQYLSNYSVDFEVPGKQSRNQWNALRRSRISRPSFIAIKINYEKFEVSGEDTVDVYFQQIYRSNTYSDDTHKIIRLRQEGLYWRFLFERTL